MKQELIAAISEVLADYGLEQNQVCQLAVNAANLVETRLLAEQEIEFMELTPIPNYWSDYRINKTLCLYRDHNLISQEIDCLSREMLVTRDQIQRTNLESAKTDLIKSLRNKEMQIREERGY